MSENFVLITFWINKRLQLKVNVPDCFLILLTIKSLRGMNLTFVCFQEEEAKDQEILNEPEIEIPDKPEEFNKEQARKDIIAKAKEIRRRPGEPKLYPEVTSTQPITEASKCPRSGSHSLTLFYFTQFMLHVCVVQSFIQHVWRVNGNELFLQRRTAEEEWCQ